jgi:hypothetical protein
MARAFGNDLFTKLNIGTYVPGATPGTGTGTADKVVSIPTGGSYTNEPGHEVVWGFGGQGCVLLGGNKRIIQYDQVLKDLTHLAYCFRATNVQTFPQCLVALTANDMGFGATLTDCYVNKLDLKYSGRLNHVTAKTELWGLRKAAGVYAAQGAAAGNGPMQGAHLTTATLETVNQTSLASVDLSFNNNLGWHWQGGVPTSTEELEPDGFNIGPEEVTGTIVFYSAQADATTNLEESSLNEDLDLVLTFTRSARTLTLTLGDCFATGETHTMPGRGETYVHTLNIRNAKAWGALTVAVT